MNAESANLTSGVFTYVLYLYVLSSAVYVFLNAIFLDKWISFVQNELLLIITARVVQDMLRMVEVEKQQRAQLMEGGVRAAEREAFELLPEDERQCALCKTTVFMSALTVVNGRDDQVNGQGGSD